MLNVNLLNIAMNIQGKQYNGSLEYVNLITPIAMQVFLSEGKTFIDNHYIVDKLRSMELPANEIKRIESGLCCGSISMLDVLESMRNNWKHIYDKPECYRLLTAIVQYYSVNDLDLNTFRRLKKLYEQQLGIQHSD